MRVAVARLGERDRELIALRYGADLKVREIAELLGERTNTIEVALHRALGRLREELADDQTAAAAAGPALSLTRLQVGIARWRPKPCARGDTGQWPRRPGLTTVKIVCIPSARWPGSEQYARCPRPGLKFT